MLKLQRSAVDIDYTSPSWWRSIFIRNHVEAREGGTLGGEGHARRDSMFGRMYEDNSARPPLLGQAMQCDGRGNTRHKLSTFARDAMMILCFLDSTLELKEPH